MAGRQKGGKAGMQGSKVGRLKRVGRRNFCLPALNSCLSALLPFCLAGVFISGCARAQAKITPDGPLEMPAPPPREVEPVESEPPPLVPLAQEPARNTPARPRPTPAPTREPPRTDVPKPEPAKPETQPVEAKPVEE